MRKPFYVDHVELTEEILEEAAKWCKGQIHEEGGRRYIKVKVDNVINEKQTKGFPGDFLLKSTNGFKVYTAKSFYRNFEVVKESVPAQASVPAGS